MKNLTFDLSPVDLESGSETYALTDEKDKLMSWSSCLVFQLWKSLISGISRWQFLTNFEHYKTTRFSSSSPEVLGPWPLTFDLKSAMGTLRTKLLNFLRLFVVLCYKREGDRRMDGQTQGKGSYDERATTW